MVGGFLLGHICNIEPGGALYQLDQPQSLFSREPRCNVIRTRTAMRRGVSIPFQQGTSLQRALSDWLIRRRRVSIPFQQGTSLQRKINASEANAMISQSLFSRELRCNWPSCPNRRRLQPSQSLFSRELRCNGHLSEARLADICGPACENLSGDRPSAT